MTTTAYNKRLATLQQRLSQAKPPFRLKKSTTSNLFRYTPRQSKAQSIPLTDFNHVLSLDPDQQTLEVEGLTTIEDIVDYTLAQGFMPQVAPELKHITIGGATVGIGIESSCGHYGFVHDQLIEADVLLADGSVVTATGDNEYADLFHALPNSYGSLGYILRAVIKLIPALPYVKVTNKRYHEIQSYLKAMEQAVTSQQYEFVEGLFYSRNELYLTLGNMVNSAPKTENIYRSVYYKMLRTDNTIYLPTKDYIFRYDPDWFWNVPENGFYKIFRAFAPTSMRSSKFYNWYCNVKNKWLNILKINKDDGQEQLIQDWEVPWSQAQQLVEFAVDNVDLADQPWVALPIKTPRQPTIYPVRANELYFNLGCYCLTKRPRPDQPYYYTKIMDEQCFKLGGLKMLYSSTFISQDEFDSIYNGSAYQQLKHKYDPNGYLPTLGEKALANA